MNIPVRCHTNLDLHPCEVWPDHLICRPDVGDIIRSSTGLELKVVRIEHCFSVDADWLDVELHLPSPHLTISDFENWYSLRQVVPGM